MNSRLLLFLLLVLIASCGVKGDPVPPKDVVVPSLLESYPDIQVEKPLGDNLKFR